MAGIIFDIETVGENFEALDAVSQEYFLKYAESEAEKQEAKNSLSFYPLTAQIVAIGMLEVESERGFVFFQNGGKSEEFSSGDIRFSSGDEKFILSNFWSTLKKYEVFITFNGRTFDCPFVLVRSAINNLRPSKNLMPYRYSVSPHVDLADQLTFYDAVRRRFSLHMWCRAFNIASPKQQGITGLDVKDLYRDARYKEIARYCLGDIQATKKLYHYWEKYLKF